MSVLIRFCLIESFNIKVGKGNVLMRSTALNKNQLISEIERK
jgi:hypothetical protein